MIRFAIALVVGGAVLTFIGYNENKLASAAEAEPKQMTVAELIASGPGDNAHIVLSDFWLLDSQSVVEYKGEDQSRYSKIWSPVITSDDPYVAEYLAFMDSDDLTAPPYNGSIQIVLYSEEINDDDDFYALLNQKTVQGLIVNEIETIEGEELALLKQGLPGINADTVLIFEHNRKPKGTGTTMLMMVGGVLLILAGPGLFFLGRRKS